MDGSQFTPKRAAEHQRYTRIRPSMIWGITALVLVFLTIVLALILMPPLG